RPGPGVLVPTFNQVNCKGHPALFHDAGGDRSQTVAALREILPWLKERGYAFGFPVR
ncbi:polysaccharide deacetylase family protein, partial [Streptomyces sp. NPDC059466]